MRNCWINSEVVIIYNQHQWSSLQAGFWRGSTAGEKVRSDRQARCEWTSGTGSRSKALFFPLIKKLVIYFLFLWMITVWRRSASFRSTSSSTSSSSSSSFASSPLCSSLSPSTSSSPLRYPFYKIFLNVMRKAQNFGQTLSGAKHSSRTCLPPPVAHLGSLSHHVGNHVHHVHHVGHHVPHMVSN